MVRSLLSIGCAATLALTSCASIVSDSSYTVTIDTAPSGEQIVVENQAGRAIYSGDTPVTLTLDAWAGYFDGESYLVRTPDESSSSVLESGVDGWYSFGNLFSGLVIGWLIVDPATGAMYSLPDHFVLTVGPKS
ncbi:MAG: hypothetical protein ACYTG5_03075 [Planctomycetota bacterium]|jgi:hypothetical protein